MFKKVLKTKRGKWAVALAVIAVIGSAASISKGDTAALSSAAILLAIAAALVLSAVRSIKNPPPVKPANIKPIGAPDISLNIKIETTQIDVERFIAPGEKMTFIDLDGYVSPSGGFANWGTFDVTGTNSATHRRNKRRYDAKTESEAISKAEKDGLVAPFDITAVAHDEPTERQIAYLESWGMSVPDGAKKSDVSAILSRLEDSNDIVSEKRISKVAKEERIRPLPSPSYEFARFADSKGVMFSRYIGHSALFDATIYSLSSKDRAAFYAYCVLCANDKTEIGDIQNDKRADQLTAFAEYAIKDPALIKSIEGRDSSDYLHPHKGTTAYKAVAAYFHL